MIPILLALISGCGTDPGVEEAQRIAGRFHGVTADQPVGTIWEKCDMDTEPDVQSPECHLGKMCVNSIWVDWDYCEDLPSKCGGPAGCACRQMVCDGSSPAQCEGDVSKCPR